MKKGTPKKNGPALARRLGRATRSSRAEATPEAQTAWLAGIVASSNDAIIGKNLRGIITSWNRGAQQLFGYDAAEAVGRSILFLIPPDHRQEEELILGKIAAGEQVDHYETVRVRKDGRKVQVSLTVSPIKDSSGKIVGASKIARDISERVRSEKLLRAATAALLQSEKQVLAVSEDERRRVGADLHDNVGQQLTAIELLCHSLREELRREPTLEAQMARICQFLQKAVTQTRRLARGLMPVSLDAEGLVDGLSELARQMSHGPLRCEFICAAPVEIHDNAVASHLFRIAQEAVNNAAKHARARRVTIRLSQNRETVRLRIEDDGRGFPKSKKSAPDPGLQTMRHRAHVIGATLKIRSVRGRGATITCSLKRA
jgi:PAS domain S-box-containing protein